MFSRALSCVKTSLIAFGVSVCLMVSYSHAESLVNSNHPPSSSQIETLFIKAQALFESDSEKAQAATEQVYQAAKKHANKEQQIRALLLLAKIAKQKQQHYLVQKYLAETEILLPQVDDVALGIQAYTILAKTAQSLKKYQSSLAYSGKRLTLAKANSDNEQLYLAYRQKGQTLKSMKRYDDALNTFLEAQRYGAKLNGFYQFQAFWNLVGIYGSLNDHAMRIAYINKGIDVLYESNNIKELPKAFNQLARSQRHLHQYESAIANAKKAIVLAREQNNQKMVAFSSVTLSRIYRWLGSYENAQVHCREAVEIYEALGDVNGLASAANALGLIYKHLEQHEYAIEYHQKVLALPVNKINPKYLGAALRELAQQYFYIGKKDEAFVLIKQAYDVYKKAKSKKGRVSVQKIMGTFYLDLGDKESALASYYKALELSRLIGDDWNEAEVLVLIGVLKTDISTTEAKQVTLEGLAIAKEIKVKWIMEQAYSALITIEEARNNDKAVEEYTALKSQIQASIEEERMKKNTVSTQVLKQEKLSDNAINVKG